MTPSTTSSPSVIQTLKTLHFWRKRAKQYRRAREAEMRRLGIRKL